MAKNKTEGVFRLIIPKYDNSLNKIKPKELEPYIKDMSDRFGGVTINPSVLGCWYNAKKKKTQCEENIIIASARDSSDKKQLKKDYAFVKDLARKAGRSLGQESVYSEHDIVRDVTFSKGKEKEKLAKYRLGIDFFEKLL